MPQKVWEDPLLDACGAGASGDDRLYSTSRIARMPVTLEQKSSLTSLKMGTQLVRQRRQDRHVAISTSFGMHDVNLRRISVQSFQPTLLLGSASEIMGTPN